MKKDQKNLFFTQYRYVKICSMKNLSNNHLKLIRNIVCVLGISVGFLLWWFLPDTFKNTRLFHIGSGEYGSKYGALCFLLIQLFALIPNLDKEEIHTDDAEERAMLTAKRERKELIRQIITAAFLAITRWAVFIISAFMMNRS